MTDYIKAYEAVHGRKPEGCVIHHRNGDPSDNRLENLVCVTRSNHIKHHRSGEPLQPIECENEPRSLSGAEAMTPRVASEYLGMNVAMVRYHLRQGHLDTWDQVEHSAGRPLLCITVESVERLARKRQAKAASRRKAPNVVEGGGQLVTRASVEELAAKRQGGK